MKIIQWFLSKLFPYKAEKINSNLEFPEDWNNLKIKESEQFYCGSDGTGGNYDT